VERRECDEYASSAFLAAAAASAFLAAAASLAFLAAASSAFLAAACLPTVCHSAALGYVFYQATAFNQPIGGWNTASATTMDEAFYKATVFNQNLAVWNVLRVTSLARAFDSTTALSDCNKRAISSAWGSTLQAAYPAWSSLQDCTRCESDRLIALGWVPEVRVKMRPGVGCSSVRDVIAGQGASR
jgi:surface protein